MYLDPRDFPFIPGLEAQSAAIRAEMVAVAPGFAPWPQRELYGEGWDVFGLMFMGQKDERNVQACPATMAAIEAVPGVRTAGFSLLKPGTHIRPHVGFGDGVLRCHLGLVVPDGCAMRVGPETRTWEEGRCLVFDDTTEHEVWHRGTEPRAVLLVDFDKSLAPLPSPPGARIEGVVLYGHDEAVAEWVRRRIPEMAGYSFGPCSAIGILREGQLRGGVVFNCFHDRPDGGDVTINAAFEPDCRVSPSTIHQIYRYPFVQLGCRRLTDFVLRSNKKARRLAERCGFKLEGVRRQGFGREDIFMYGMLRSECRYLTESERE